MAAVSRTFAPLPCSDKTCGSTVERENVDVRRTEISVVHGADANEPDGGTGLRVVAPNCDPASRAASDLLAFAARRGRHDDFGLSGGVYDTIGFIESVERMRGSGLALAPAAMTGMNNQWRSDQTISDLPARAKWLASRLYRFTSVYPEVDVRVSSSMSNANFTTDGVDVAIRNLPSSAAANSALVIEKLIELSLVPVCSPRLVEMHGPLERPGSAQGRTTHPRRHARGRDRRGDKLGGLVQGGRRWQRRRQSRAALQ